MAREEGGEVSVTLPVILFHFLFVFSFPFFFSFVMYRNANYLSGFFSIFSVVLEFCFCALLWEPLLLMQKWCLNFSEH